MAVEVTHNKATESKVEWQFPCLGKLNSARDILLFTKKSVGTVIVNDVYELGEHCLTWRMEGFTPLSPSESITLRNV